MYQLWESATLGPLTLKNRVVRSATNEHLSQADGGLSQAWLDTYLELAQNEVGLIITGHFAVDRRYRADEGQTVLDEASDLSLLEQAAAGVHAAGGVLVAQLSHSGWKAPQAVNGRPPKGPADFQLDELDQLVEQFTLAARRCQAAGLDGVQIHTAHGYLLSNFLNPQENSRTDGYGGSLENRFAIIQRILSSIRQACGDQFALLVKADSNGCGDLHRLLQLYQAAGVDGVELSGVDFAARAGQKEPFYLTQALQARTGISLPLILVGGIFSRQAAQQVLDAGIPFVSFSRALICQPDFIARMKAGVQDASTCLACNGCYKVYRQRPVRCVQHQSPIPQLTQVFSYPSP
jgi:2,4-dienoyl-CoA reductase-like NADH-dependent reductase (Old Yellow Enzyme family)